MSRAGDAARKAGEAREHLAETNIVELIAIMIEAALAELQEPECVSCGSSVALLCAQCAHGD